MTLGGDKTMKVRKRPPTVDAVQWFRNGDHPEDGVGEIAPDPAGGTYERVEGAVVGFFRRPEPEYAGHLTHELCGRTWHEHGWIDTLKGGHIVCPADWVITDVQGERYPCKPNIFAATYEPAESAEVQASQAPPLHPTTMRPRLFDVVLPAEGTADRSLVIAVRQRINAEAGLSLIGNRAVWALVQAIRQERPDGDLDPRDQTLLEAIAVRAGMHRGGIRLRMAYLVMKALTAEAAGEPVNPDCPEHGEKVATDAASATERAEPASAVPQEGPEAPRATEGVEDGGR